MSDDPSKSPNSAEFRKLGSIILSGYKSHSLGYKLFARPS